MTDISKMFRGGPIDIRCDDCGVEVHIDASGQSRLFVHLDDCSRRGQCPTCGTVTENESRVLAHSGGCTDLINLFPPLTEVQRARLAALLRVGEWPRGQSQ
jgi:hypothetical protein